MATINIGSLSLSSHKGDYDNTTSYVKNDVVYYASTGSAYIAKQATTGNLPTSTAHWNVFSAGSGGIWNAGLSLGSAGQAVKVNSAGNALEFGTISSDFVKLSTTTISSATTNVDIDNVFNQSGYNCFKIIINKFRCSAADALYMRFLDNNGSQYSAGNYRWGVTGQEASSGGTNDGQQGYDWNSTNVKVAGTGGHISTDTNNKGTFILEMIVSNPYQSGKTGFHWINSYLRNTGDNHMSMRGGGHLNDSTVVRGVRFTMGSGNVEEGIFTVYGIK